MTTLSCIIVDDEPLALDVLESHISRIPSLKLLGKCRNALEASEALKKEKPDLLFMDIQMPEITGIDFIRSLGENSPVVIFTTAYPDYAVDAFSLEALDYLVKPVSFERFRHSVERAQEYFELRKNKEDQKIEMEDGHLFVKSDSKLVKIGYDEILFVEAFADYVKIWISDEKRIITLQTMKNMASKLPQEKFVRVHRSFIVSLNKIRSISGTEVQIGKKVIPIGKNYKDEFMGALQQNNIIK